MLLPLIFLACISRFRIWHCQQVLLIETAKMRAGT